jgi:hypothetical protein
MNANLNIIILSAIVIIPSLAARYFFGKRYWHQRMPQFRVPKNVPGLKTRQLRDAPLAKVYQLTEYRRSMKA